MVTSLSLFNWRIQTNLERQENGITIKSVKKRCNDTKYYNLAKTFTCHKKHLPLVLVRQQEQTKDSGVRNLVVKCLSVQVKEGRVDANIISKKRNCLLCAPFINRNDYWTGLWCIVCLFIHLLPSSGCKALQLFEDTHSISSGLDNVRLRQHILGECLRTNTYFY